MASTGRWRDDIRSHVMTSLSDVQEQRSVKLAWLVLGGSREDHTWLQTHYWTMTYDLLIEGQATSWSQQTWKSDKHQIHPTLFSQLIILNDRLRSHQSPNRPTSFIQPAFGNVEMYFKWLQTPGTNLNISYVIWNVYYVRTFFKTK